MRWLAGAALLALGAIAAAREPLGIRVLSNGRARGREAVLVDALRIYTRDLGRTVRLGGAPPASLEPEPLARLTATAQADGDEVVVWFGERAGAQVLFALRAASGELRETPVGLDEPAQAARALALKVRALVAARRDAPGWAVAPEAPPRAPEAAPHDTATDGGAAAATDGGVAAATDGGASRSDDSVPAAAPASIGAPAAIPPAGNPGPTADATDAAKRAQAATDAAKRAQAATTDAAAARPASAPARAGNRASAVHRSRAADRPVWLEATAAYQATVPTQIDWVRHGLLVRLAVPWGRLPAVAFVDAAFASEPSAAVGAGTVSARVWPVGAGALVRLRRPRWSLAGGPRVSLQIVDATAHGADGRAGAARRYSAGLGLTGEVTWRFSRWVGAIASLGAEALVPRLEFHAGAPASTDLGWVQLAFAGGLVFSIP